MKAALALGRPVRWLFIGAGRQIAVWPGLVAVVGLAGLAAECGDSSGATLRLT